MKIAIIGYSCSGKSTLAKRLSKSHDLPLMYLDTIFFKPHWTKRDNAESCEIIGDWMDEHDGWVIDGNYAKLLQERRFDEADYIVFLDFPVRVCMKRAKQRFKEYAGRTRESMAFGCDEKLDSEFINWIKRGERTRYTKAAFERTKQRYADKFVHCKNDSDVERFIASLQ